MLCTAASSRRHDVFSITVLVAVLLAASRAGSAFGAGAEDMADVPHVRNADVPRDGSMDFRLEELWRVGGEDGDVLFGMVSQVREDADGNIYVMDAQLSEVHVFSPDGEHLRTLFGEGDGPGEIRGPRDLVLLDDGRVGLVQEMPGKLVFVDRLGDPAGQLRIGGEGTSHGGFCQTFSAFTDGEQLLVAGFLQRPGVDPGTMVQTSFLSGFGPDGTRRVDFATRENTISMADFVFEEAKLLAPFWWNAAVGPDGLVYVAPDLERYRLEVSAPDGRLVRVIERDYEPWRRSEADKAWFVEMVRAIYSGTPFEIGVEPMETEPAVVYLHRGLRVRPDGSIWVLSTRGIRSPEAGAMVTFDVFDPDGVYVRRVNVHGPWNGRTDTVLLVDDDHAVVVTGFKDAMIAQFTNGNMTVDLEGEAGSVEVIFCRVRRN